jgi:NAD(P)-dependent dehydrogenase (short-subunit alcohol dehydrogenase family)
MESRVPDTLLAGRTVIVTGAARGVGKGIATALVQRGASVLLVDRDGELLTETADTLTAPDRAVALVADLRDDDSAVHIVDAALDAFGDLHGLVNNAIATNEPKPFHEITREDYDLVFDVGPRATFDLMRAAYPVFLRNGGGSIVNLGSGSGTIGKSRFGAYAGAKEAIRGMSKVAALEWARHNIRVNVVCPFAESDGIRLWRELAPEAYERTVRTVPMGRLGDVATDIGPVVTFLLSDEAAFVTAQTIMVDGGSAGFR